MENRKVTMIVSTYNRPDALVLCLESIRNQRVLPDEVIVGDDGSGEETSRVIRQAQLDFPVPLRHIWHEDKGFRLAMMRNKCLAAARYDYIIQVDGDLILHPSFVADHLAFARKGYYLKGGRVNLTRKKTEQLCTSGRYQRIHFFTRGLSRRINAIHQLSLARYLAPRKRSAPGLGANMSFWKEDVVKINGYDEFFEGWGGEDWDFGVRMGHAGLKKLSLKFAAIVYHLWHTDKYMQNKEKNFDYYHQHQRDNVVRCEHGMDQYLNKTL